ncbi:nicotinamide riboside transporter PnuC [Pseudoxanthomonas daejeonensis]
MATVSILLAARNSVHTWWTGIVGCALFSWLFFNSQLYADVLLQFFFVVASMVGWWQWMGGIRKAPLVVRATSGRSLIWMGAIAVAAALVYGALLHRFTDAYAPFADSAVLSLSVLAQLLLMRRRVETWPVWLLVNTIAVPLYASRGLMVTAVLYSAYWINACVAWRYWHRLGDEQAMPA